jgi:probable rRNA maturation factor
MVFIESEELSGRLMELADEAVNACLDYLKCEYACDVSLSIVDNETIQSINKEHRQIDKATDVLSFPMVSWTKPCDYHYLEQNYSLLMNPETENILLGDIILSMDKVKEQAEAYEHSIEREYAFLIVHSMLHLFGYDHMNEVEEKAMISMQKDIMSTIEYQ